MARKRKTDDTQNIPGGAFILDAELREDDDGEVKHFGGRVVNAEGETLREFGPKEENTGAEGLTLGHDGVPLTLDQQRQDTARTAHAAKADAAKK